MMVHYFLEGVIVIIAIVTITIVLPIFAKWLCSAIRHWYCPYNQDKKKEKDLTK
jgi:tetrahydromethanopterin S-methyltransferase subunit E